jgi:hypothetical protein
MADVFPEYPFVDEVACTISSVIKVHVIRQQQHGENEVITIVLLETV